MQRVMPVWVEAWAAEMRLRGDVPLPEGIALPVGTLLHVRRRDAGRHSSREHRTGGPVKVIEVVAADVSQRFKIQSTVVSSAKYLVDRSFCSISRDSLEVLMGSMPEEEDTSEQEDTSEHEGHLQQEDDMEEEGSNDDNSDDGGWAQQQAWLTFGAPALSVASEHVFPWAFAPLGIQAMSSAKARKNDLMSRCRSSPSAASSHRAALLLLDPIPSPVVQSTVQRVPVAAARTWGTR